jgi:hypothetical protein
MTTAQIADLVRRWFAKAPAAGFLFPDGWFGGRPHENICTLVDAQASGDGVVLRMSEDTTLVFDHPRRVYVDAEAQLVFEGFDEATFRWKPFGEEEYREYRYGSGQVRLVATLRISMPPEGDLPGSEAGCASR